MTYIATLSCQCDLPVRLTPLTTLSFGDVCFETRICYNEYFYDQHMVHAASLTPFRLACTYIYLPLQLCNTWEPPTHNNRTSCNYTTLLTGQGTSLVVPLLQSTDDGA